MAETIATYDDIVAIEVDPQNDFCPENPYGPKGSLAVNEGDQVMDPLNRVAAWVLEKGGRRVRTRDWHKQENRVHFKTWPVHCIENTFGAAFHPTLTDEGVVVFSKGMGLDGDAYSGFDGINEQGQALEDYLAPLERRARVALIIGGLATDYCVKATVLDARKKGFAVYVPLDAVRAVNIEPDDGEKALAEIEAAGAILTTTQELIAGRVVDLRPVQV